MGVCFESFTASAERALKRADWLARRRGAAVVEPLDLLAALAAESESRAAELLVEFGVEMDRLWAELGPGFSSYLAEFEATGARARLRDAGRAPEALPVSAALRLVLNEATMQARGFDRKREVGTEHLLAGLLLAVGPAAELLRRRASSSQTLRERLTEAGLVDIGPAAARPRESPRWS